MLTTNEAVVHVLEGETILVMTDMVTVKVRSQGGAGAFALTEVLTPPRGGPPGLHRHPDQETFYVLEGRYRFDTQEQDEPTSWEAASGAVIHIPSMVWHNYTNIGQAPGRLLVVLQPGNLVDFFRELGVAVTDKTTLPSPAGLPDLARVAAITKKHHVEMMGKPQAKGA